MLREGYEDLDVLVESAASRPPVTKTSVGANVAAFSRGRTDWQREAERQLQRVIRLRRGWDGYNGRAVHPTIADYAFRLLEAVMTRSDLPLPIITPLPYGGLILEWHRRGWDIEIEIDAPAHHRVYTHELSSEQEEEIVIGADLARLGPIVARVAG